MQTLDHPYEGSEALEAFIRRHTLAEYPGSMLVRIFASRAQKKSLLPIQREAARLLPRGCVIGAVRENCTAPFLSFSLFDGASAGEAEAQSLEEGERAEQTARTLLAAASAIETLAARQRDPDKDELTGLLNRSALQRKLRTPGTKSLLFVDIDSFSHINRVYGTHVADGVLENVATMLRHNRPSNAALYRFAGDQFVFLLEHPETEQGVQLARQLVSFTSAAHIYIEELEIKVGFSIGIARGEGHGILSDAMFALEASKLRGRNGYFLYKENLQIEKRQKKNVEWMPLVRNAVEDDQIFPCFQPIVNNATGRVEKYECLTRLRLPDGKVIDPGFFLEAAKISGILTSITKIMIGKAFDYFRDKPYEFTINITEEDLQEDYLAGYLEHKLKLHGMDPARVTLEILEDITTQGAEDHTGQITVFKEMGFKVAADDFGSQHSNFARLLTLDVDYIKIDGKFIQGLEEGTRNYKIVYNIVQFAKSVGTKTVAEFVDSEETQKMVLSIGIDYSQGFFLGKPLESVV